MIKVTRNGDKFDFVCDEVKLFDVDAQERTISGENLFEKVYKNIDVSKPVCTEIDIDSLNKDDKATFGNYVVELFKEIDSAINTQFGFRPDKSEKKA
jgi:hypothetical protein